MFHMKQTKRPERKARRKARRAKVKTEIDVWRERVHPEIDRWRDTVYAQLLDLDKRVRSLEETIDTALETKSAT